MNKKYTLFKLGDKYTLFIGVWLDCRKIPNALHLKHGLLSQDEYDYIKARHKARFKWNDSMKVYEFCASDADNPCTVAQLVLYETSKSIYSGRLRKGIFSWDVARIKAEMAADASKPSDYFG